MNNYSTSPLEITARIDAALADAGLDGPMIEREPLPLLFSLLAEALGAQRILSSTPQAMIAEQIWDWSREYKHSVSVIQGLLNEAVADALDLSQAHGTLTDIKRHEVSTYQQQLMHKIHQLELGHQQHPEHQWGS